MALGKLVVMMCAKFQNDRIYRFEAAATKSDQISGVPTPQIFQVFEAAYNLTPAGTKIL